MEKGDPDPQRDSGSPSSGKKQGCVLVAGRIFGFLFGSALSAFPGLLLLGELWAPSHRSLIEKYFLFTLCSGLKGAKINSIMH